MNKIVLHTRFNPAEIANKEKVFDRHDNVDRISYVDNTTMVRRLIMEGKNLAAARAQALRSGSYSGDLKEIANDDGFAVPVYQQDAAVAQQYIDKLQEKLETSVAAKEEAARSKNDDAAAAEVTDSSSAVKDNN